MEVTILMVDDHPPMIEGYKAILSSNAAGHTIKTVAAHCCQTAHAILTETINPVAFDMAILDISLPPFEEKDLRSGVNVALLVKKHQPFSKIIILTSHTGSLLLNSILNQCKPEGLLVKSDLLSEEFLLAFDTILKGGTHYSATVKKQKHDLLSNDILSDIYNRQIIILLSQGIKTKNLHEHMHISTSAIEKRKVILKECFGIKKGTDEDILREARKRGLL